MAGYIPDEIVDKIKSDIDILDLVGEYVNLKKTGKDYTGLCPFHREKTPSFSVIPAKGFYYCFGCGASGNAVNFIMRHENIDYPDALRFLAKRAGIIIPEKTAPDKESPSAQIYRAIEFAESFFKKNLTNSSGLEYLKQRGLKSATLDEFGLGFAPDGWDNLLKSVAKDKLSTQVFFEAGLLVKKENKSTTNGEYYDKFRNRVMFPIKNISARAIGFGGRALSEQEGPKYLNSPETPIYHKGSVLYGMHLSKNYIREKNKAIILEGYFDFISVYQSGIKNIVAVSGTGFTPNQANLLARFCEEVVLLYDADSAGMKATFRAVEVLFNAGLEPKVVRLPQGFDPDSFVRKNGAAKLEALIDSAVTYIDFVNTSLPDKFSKLPISNQQKVINSLIETASNIDDASKYDLFTRKVVEIFDLPLAAMAQFKKPRQNMARAEINVKPGRIDFERSFLGFIMANPEFIEETLKLIRPEYFIDTELQQIYDRIKESKQEEFLNGDFLESWPDNGTRRRLTEIIVRDSGGTDLETRFDGMIQRFQSFQEHDKSSALWAEMARAQKEGQTDRLEQLTRAFRDLQNTTKGKVG